MKIIVASKNPVKLNATHIGFSKMFPDETLEITGVAAPSGVKDQPLSDAEALQGATNRMNTIAAQVPDADFWVGIEGGVSDETIGMISFSWTVIKSKTGKIGRGRTGSFVLPPPVAELIHQGKELGEADDIVFGTKNSKQENGAIGLLTNNIIDRTEFYGQAVIFALVPFKNQKLY